MQVYPIFLNDLEKRSCIIIGGGKEAEHKLLGLLNCAASVTVISKRITKAMRESFDRGLFAWLDREYQRGDLNGAFLVIVTRKDADMNAQIYAEAESERALVNSVDDPAHCNFIAGSVVRRGLLTIAISTSGVAPALAVRLRERFEKEIGPEYGALLELAERVRGKLSERHPDLQVRRALWYSLVDSNVLDLLRDGKYDLARQGMMEILGN